MEENKNVIDANHKRKRVGWAAAFEEMALNGDNELLIPSAFDDENIKCWSWK